MWPCQPIVFCWKQNSSSSVYIASSCVLSTAKILVIGNEKLKTSVLAQNSLIGRAVKNILQFPNFKVLFQLLKVEVVEEEEEEEWVEDWEVYLLVACHNLKNQGAVVSWYFVFKCVPSICTVYQTWSQLSWHSLLLVIWSSMVVVWIHSLPLLTLWRPAAFGDFRKKTPKCTWLRAGISPLLFRLRT